MGSVTSCLLVEKILSNDGRYKQDSTPRDKTLQFDIPEAICVSGVAEPLEHDSSNLLVFTGKEQDISSAPGQVSTCYYSIMMLNAWKAGCCFQKFRSDIRCRV